MCICCGGSALNWLAERQRERERDTLNKKDWEKSYEFITLAGDSIKEGGGFFLWFTKLWACEGFSTGVLDVVVKFFTEKFHSLPTICFTIPGDLGFCFLGAFFFICLPPCSLYWGFCKYDVKSLNIWNRGSWYLLVSFFFFGNFCSLPFIDCRKWTFEFRLPQNL